MLLDLGMPELDGVEVLKRLRAENAATRVIVFTAFDTDERILDAVQAGAQGYLLKGAPRDELFNAVRVVQAGGSLLQPIVASRLMRRVSEGHAAQEAAELLTGRELEVLRLIAQGLSNQEITQELVVALSTVKGHNLRIFAKLQAKSRTEAVARARELGLL